MNLKGDEDILRWWLIHELAGRNDRWPGQSAYCLGSAHSWTDLLKQLNSEAQEHGWELHIDEHVYLVTAKGKEAALRRRATGLARQASDQGLTREQKHIDGDSSPEKDYWHYGYAMALLDVLRNFELKEKP